MICRRCAGRGVLVNLVEVLFVVLLICFFNLPFHVEISNCLGQSHQIIVI
jgi:hypothetical protein